MILLIISFIAGVLTVLAPCTLSLLPVIVGGSIGQTENRWKKPLVIVTSLSLSIIAFTFLLKVSSVFIDIPQWIWPLISGSILVVFGVISIFPALWEKISFVSKINASSNRALGAGYQKKSITGDILIGASLGPVFSTCSPTYFVILATVLPQSFFLGLIDLIAYTVGLSGILLVIAFLGQKITSRLEGVSDTRGWFKRSLGVLFLIIGIAIIAGYDKVLEKNILNAGLFDITKIEQQLLKTFNTDSPTPDPVLTTTTEQVEVEDNTTGGSLGSTGSSTDTSAGISTGTQKPVKKIVFDNSKITSRGPVASDLVNPSGFVNTDGKPITIAQFRKKKVVLLDMWTYSCINCQRTIPYINAWYDKYKDIGLEVIGLHTPEFAFEKVQKNVEGAVAGFGIKYPVVLDNQRGTWNAYGNQYWPRKYLINANGEIVYDHTGEGDYDITEKQIQQALQELANAQGSNIEVPTTITNPNNAVTTDASQIGSPEIYFGSARNEYLGNGKPGEGGEKTFTIKNSDVTNPWFNTLLLGGVWDIQNDHAVSKGPASIVFKYRAKNVYMVLSGGDKTVTIIPYIDGVKQNPIQIGANILYQIVKGTDYTPHVLHIEVEGAGLEAYTFTFG